MSTISSLSTQDFKKQLAFGQIAESKIAKWLLSRGASVLPIYEIEYDSGKGPRLFASSGELIAPDLLTFTNGQLIWIEAKHKTVFSWYRIKERWVTGIDLRHYEDYLKVREHLKIPVWLLFLHVSATPCTADLRYDCPPQCPTGLFGHSLDILASKESHRSTRHGRTGMVYWAHETLKHLADI